MYQVLATQGWLKSYEVLGGLLLVGLDGTEYFSSEQIHCPQCSHRTHKTGRVSYPHNAILPVIVAPEQEPVITLTLEFMRPQGGVDKQDSETAATKRWIERHHNPFPKGGVTLLGDDLYSRHPMCQECLDHELNFIFVCLPSAQPTLYEWLEYLESNGKVYTRQERFWNGRYYEI